MKKKFIIKKKTIDLFFFLCKKKNKSSMLTKDKVSEGSQFHQPPHEPSWKAHHAPKKSAPSDKNSDLYVKKKALITNECSR